MDFLVLLSILLNNGRIVVEIIKTMPKYKLNPAQKQAIEHTKGPLLIVAGAGTGKTTVLTQRVFHLLEKKKLEPDNV